MQNLTSQDKKFLKLLGVRIRELREARGWTLEETEEHGWPSWRHLQRIETGHKNVTITTLKRVSHTIGISISELLKDL
jgi:transcriptional regulator with XRE-family HTH domain